MITNQKLLSLGAALTVVTALAANPVRATLAPAPATAAPAALHCQVPCGIYGDRMRIDMMMEDASTIEKAMKSLIAMDGEESPSKNQMVRWVVNKEQHAQNIQDQVAAYWLAQRIKAPTERGEGVRAKYHGQLAILHQITVAAMKCKQTTDVANVVQLRKLALEFSATYFSEDDLKHIRSHHGHTEAGR